MTSLTDLLRRVEGAQSDDDRCALVRPLTLALVAVAGEDEYPSIVVLVSDALGFKCSGQGHVEEGAALALVEKLLSGWRVKRIEEVGAICYDGARRGDWRCELWEHQRGGSGSGHSVNAILPLAILAALLKALIAKEAAGGETR